MAFNAGTVRGELELEISKFREGVKRAGAALQTLDKQVKENAQSTRTFESRLAVLRDLFLVVPGITRAVVAPFKALFNVLKEGSEAAANFQQTVQNLSVSLAQAGVRNVEGVTNSLKDFAAATQDATAFSDSQVLQVSQTLVAMGVQEDALEANTKAVLDYSAAFGRNAVEAAKLFGKTLGGNLGELAEALPALVGTSKAALALGGAFDFASDQFGGFSEQAAKTTKGLRAQLVNAFGDLQKEIGFAINPVLDALTAGATEAVKSVRGIIAGNREGFTNAFRDLAAGAVEALRGITDKAIDLPAALIQVRIFIAQVQAAFAGAAGALEIRFAELSIRVRAEIAQILQAFEGAGFLFSGLAEAGNEVAASVQTARAELEASKEAAKASTAELDAGVKALEAQQKDAQAVAAAFRETGVATTKWQQAIQGANNALDITAQKLAEVGTNTQNTIELTNSAAKSVSKALGIWRKVNEAAAETAGAAGGVASATDQATASTERLADAAGRARSEFEGAASAASSAGSAASGGSLFGGGTAGDSRRRGGSAGLDLSTVEGAQSALNAARNASAASVGGLFSNQARTSAFLTGQQIQKRLTSLQNEAVAEFTRGVLDELNRAGIFDTSARQDTINARIDEARRLGTLPAPPRVSSAVGTVF